MSEKRENLFVRVKDMAGNEFVCPIEALKSPKDLSNAELENCVDYGTVKNYTGNIKIKIVE